MYYQASPKPLPQGLFVRLICHSRLALLSYDMGMAVETRQD